MTLSIVHHTRYDYASAVAHSQHLLHLSARPLAWQQTLGQHLAIVPEPSLRQAGADAFGNPIERLAIDSTHQSLSITLHWRVAVGPRPWQTTAAPSIAWEAVAAALAYGGGGPLEPAAFLYQSPHVRIKHQLEAFARPSFASGRPLFDAVCDLCRRIHAEFTYLPASTSIETSVLEVLNRRQGVCQDFAHLMIGGLRALGLAARYVSGYLRTDPPAGQSRLLGVDASHAWVAVFIPPLGWVELDPTNGCLADERYAVLAWGRDFSDVSPIRGVIQGGGQHRLTVQVTVEQED